MPSLLEVDDVTVVFGGNRALDGAGLRAERGAVTGLIGPNGAGKSTLFDVICGLRKPTKGRVAIDGADVTRLGPARRARHGLARTFQRLELFGRLSVRDNLLVAAELGPQRRHAARIVAEIIDRLGLHEIADACADELPTGTGRLVEVGRAIAARPSLILLDEPAAGQDPTETERFGELLRSLADDGAAVLLVEHDMGLVMNVCDEVFVLDLGKVIASGPPAVIRADETVLAAYLGDV
ncbi:ABC transporter ATP-binding protein [Nocardia implantans]|uniref:ABC transporter ATP-binding protein n=1 Tax=Nocardia implantans TaxID=3108168 RepID=A0ABU6ART7_9NOCA|nr:MULTISPECIES: ABC transporter ATP-binding protein [unclassified Nocardia]MBF6191656.1 ABC transporter ATP-binding protein [Nocardia beijingensis]MEA3528037.1 ABC transporter ATP-binding protein [Nocardia sp. CDC192]MEB3510211.1 ABC transporter ATP-binding protein [Nocardia sp. CDC186]